MLSLDFLEHEDVCSLEADFQPIHLRYQFERAYPLLSVIHACARYEFVSLRYEFNHEAVFEISCCCKVILLKLMVRDLSILHLLKGIVLIDDVCPVGLRELESDDSIDVAYEECCCCDALD